MTEQERQKIKAELIEFGFWGVSEPGDPTTDIHAAGKLNDRLQTKLAKGVYLISKIASDHSLIHEVVIFHEHQICKLALSKHSCHQGQSSSKAGHPAIVFSPNG